MVQIWNPTPMWEGHRVTATIVQTGLKEPRAWVADSTQLSVVPAPLQLECPPSFTALALSKMHLRCIKYTMFGHMHVCMHVRTYVCMHAWMCVCMAKYVTHKYVG